MTRRILKRFSPRKGFTLVELIVVVLIVGILAAFAIPQYTKTVEASKADDAAGIVKLVGTANRMFKLDKGVLASGLLSNTCTTDCNSAGMTGCALVACRYLANMDWSSKAYQFYACNGSNTCGSQCGQTTGVAACAKRCSGNPPCTNNSVYLNWCYSMTSEGAMGYYSGSNPAPKPPS